MGRKKRRKNNKDDGRAALVLFPFALAWWGFTQNAWITSVALVLLVAAGIWFYLWKKKNDFTALLGTEVQDLSPYEFEQYVAALISSMPGWKAHATQASGDQGCDVIATSPAGSKTIIQVKHYANNVGNKAVQEIVAAKPLYKAQEAMVVTSGPGYTRAAVELAAANNVTLWTLKELGQVRRAAEKRQALGSLVGARSFKAS